MPLYRPLTRCHRPLAPPHCSLTPLFRLLTALFKPSMPFHRPLMPLRLSFSKKELYIQKSCLNLIRIFTTNYTHCYVLFYDMFWQYNQIMHYILDILNINMTMTALVFGQCDLSCWMVTVTFQTK